MKKDQQGSGTNTMPSLVYMPENTNKVEKTTLQNPHHSACQHNLALVINERVVYQMSHCDLHISHSKLRLCRREWDKAHHAQFCNQSMSLTKEYVGSDSVVCDYSDIKKPSHYRPGQAQRVPGS